MNEEPDRVQAIDQFTKEILKVSKQDKNRQGLPASWPQIHEDTCVREVVRERALQTFHGLNRHKHSLR